MKKFLIIFTTLLIAEPSFADNNITMTAFAISFYGLAAIAAVASIFTFTAGLAIAVPVFLASGAYYQTKYIALNALDEPDFYETTLCPAAQDLRLNISTAYSDEIYGSKEFKKISKLDPFFSPNEKINKEPNLLCPRNASPKCFKKLKNAEYSNDEWQPIKAFSYDGKSFMQFKQMQSEDKYITATAKFEDVFPYLSYNNTFIFRQMHNKYKIRDLCPLLRRVSVHELKNRKA